MSGEQLFEPRGRLRTIILAGRGFSLTDEAIRWASREGVAILAMCRSGECFAVIADAAGGRSRRSALILREKQFKAVLDPRKRLAIAKRIVFEKLRTQGLPVADARAFLAELQKARKLEDVLTVEARAGAAFFMQFRSAMIRFKAPESVPDRWRAFTARAGSRLSGKGGVSRARHVSHPAGAMLNYAFAVALGNCVRACTALGADVHFGFLHSPKPGRVSLAYDVLELFRAGLTRAVFAFAGKRVFLKSDFEMNARGIVRLGPGIGREVAALAIKTAPFEDCLKAAGRLARF